MSPLERLKARHEESAREYDRIALSIVATCLLEARAYERDGDNDHANNLLGQADCYAEKIHNSSKRARATNAIARVTAWLENAEQNRAEAAYDRYVERCYGDDCPRSLAEQCESAWKTKHGVDNG